MLFNTIPYLLFLPAAVALYYVVPNRFRWLPMVLASSVFLMFAQFGFWIVAAAAVLITYLSTLESAGAKTPRTRKQWLVAGIIGNLSLLVFYKYHTLIPRGSASLSALMGVENPIPWFEYLLPLGISYYVFQAISYQVDVYRNTQKVSFHLGKVAAYLLFFPRLLAGPIERASDFLPQIETDHRLGYGPIRVGARLILWGFFKKMVVADRLAEITSPVYDNVEAFAGFPLWLVVMLYPIQLYADFSGYTDIALGSAKLMGFNLAPNFDRPFVSRSVTEFWRRWHISLSSWVRDYLFTPLSLELTMKRGLGKLGTWLALLVGFTVLGIWHGAKWTFLVFGLLQGAALIWERLTINLRKDAEAKTPGGFYGLIAAVFTFLFFAVSCIFFRADTLGDAVYVMRSLFAADQMSLAFWEYHYSFSRLELTLIAVVFFMIFDHLICKTGFEKWAGQQKLLTRWSIYALFIASILMLAGVAHEPFAYFKF